MKDFAHRHIGPSQEEITEMLSVIGTSTVDKLIDLTVPPVIRLKEELDLPEALTEEAYLRMLKKIAGKNKIYRSYIGQGYYNTCLLYTSPSPRDATLSRMPSSA